jgi:predicted double-glycine peptidase
MKEIAFRYKQKSFSCGPAALRMIIQTLIDYDVGEEILIELLGTNELTGTPLFAFEEKLTPLLTSICLLKQIPNHFKTLIKQNSSIDELLILQNNGYVIALNYTKPDGQAHWAVLIAVTDHVVTLMDPDFGPHHQYQLDNFNWTGGSSTTPTNHAIVAIKYSN